MIVNVDNTAAWSTTGLIMLAVTFAIGIFLLCLLIVGLTLWIRSLKKDFAPWAKCWDCGHWFSNHTSNPPKGPCLRTYGTASHCHCPKFA